MHESAWVDADRNHRPILQSFTCATPRPRAGHRRTLAHPKPWEYGVQAYIRRLKPPVRGDVTLLGIVGDAIGSVAQFVCQTHPEMPVVLVRVAAVSVDYRGQGGQLADATLQAVLSRGATDLAADGHRHSLVVARVNLSNAPSQALLLRHGFMPDGRRTKDQGPPRMDAPDRLVKAQRETDLLTGRHQDRVLPTAQLRWRPVAVDGEDLELHVMDVEVVEDAVGVLDLPDLGGVHLDDLVDPVHAHRAPVDVSALEGEPAVRLAARVDRVGRAARAARATRASQGRGRCQLAGHLR